MLGVIILVPPITGLDYHFTTSPLDNTVPVNLGEMTDGEKKRKHMTYIFTVFVCLQLFNEINCRKIGRRDFNILESIFTNYLLYVVLATLAFQVAVTQYLPALFRTTPLDRSEWGGCLALGATPWLISVLLKLTPASWLAKVKLDKLVDEDRSMGNKAIINIYNKTAKLKVKIPG